MWDISSCWANSSSSSAGAGNAKPQELARQASDYNIQCLRFVPWGEPGRLVTAGKNSVRVHRLREGQLCGLSVPFDSTLALRRRPYSCGTLASGAPGSTVGEVFTCLGFERAQQVRPLSPRRLYAGALSGRHAAPGEGWVGRFPSAAIADQLISRMYALTAPSFFLLLRHALHD